MLKPKRLTDIAIGNLKPAPAGKRYAVPDPECPGLKVRVTDRGSMSFILWRRYGGAKNPAARLIGVVGTMKLAEAREKARGWLEDIKKGNDPREEQRKKTEAETERKNATFKVVLEDYFARHVRGQRKEHDVKREMRRELLGRWGRKPVTEITRNDVTRLIESIVDRDAPYQAHNVLGHVKTFFNWAIERGIYGLDVSPADRIKPTRLIGPKTPRQRALNDAELRAFWRAADGMGYPYGNMFQMLALTGQRKSEVSRATWGEFNLADKVWTVPPERFKSNSAHQVPLTSDVQALLDRLPRWAGGEFLFSTSGGRKAVNNFSHAKAALDQRVLRTLRAMARQRGERPGNMQLPPFVLHDLRRTVRTRLSSLRVSDAVAEMVIGHGRRGLQRVYDQHRYLDEMREALTAWETKLRTIVNPPPPSDNVVPLREVVS